MNSSPTLPVFFALAVFLMAFPFPLEQRFPIKLRHIFYTKLRAKNWIHINYVLKLCGFPRLMVVIILILFFQPPFQLHHLFRMAMFWKIIKIYCFLIENIKMSTINRPLKVSIASRRHFLSQSFSTSSVNFSKIQMKNNKLPCFTLYLTFPLPPSCLYFLHWFFTYLFN